MTSHTTPEMRAQGEALNRKSSPILCSPSRLGRYGKTWKGHSLTICLGIATPLSSGLSPRLARLVAGSKRTRRVGRGSTAAQTPGATNGIARRAEIGGYLAAVVDNWDTATLVNRVELQVGKDLQYIRINGTLVGGLVGLLIFTLSRAFGG